MYAKIVESFNRQMKTIINKLGFHKPNGIHILVTSFVVIIRSLFYLSSRQINQKYYLLELHNLVHHKKCSKEFEYFLNSYSKLKEKLSALSNKKEDK